MAAQKKTEGSVKQDRNRYTATGESATREDTVKGMNPKKAIGFSEMRVKEKPQVETTESLPQDHPMMQPRAKKEPAKKAKLSPEARFAKVEKANRELDEAEGSTSNRGRAGARYEGAGPESGQLTTTTNYPIPTTKLGGASTQKSRVANTNRQAYDFAGSSGDLAYEGKKNETTGAVLMGRSSEEQHAGIVKRLRSAKPHQVEGIKKELDAHEGTYGTPSRGTKICRGPRCTADAQDTSKFSAAYGRGEVEWAPSPRGTRAPTLGREVSPGHMSVQARVPFAPQDTSGGGSDYCAGDSCASVTSSRTPTPRPPKNAVEGDGYA
jgi:hypothetical protein